MSETMAKEEFLRLLRPIGVEMLARAVRCGLADLRDRYLDVGVSLDDDCLEVCVSVAWALGSPGQPAFMSRLADISSVYGGDGRILQNLGFSMRHGAVTLFRFELPARI